MNRYLALLATTTLFGCSVDRSGFSPNDTGVMPPRFDAGMDASADAGEDAGEDSGMDAGEDVGVDTGIDDAGCIEGTSVCADDTATVCSGGTFREQSCGGLGCIDDHCARIDPSNGLEFGPASAIDWNLPSGALIVDTSVVGSEGCSAIVRGLCVLRVRTFRMAAGSVLRVRGPNPLVVLADGEISIGGSIDLTASRTRPGPGGFGGGETAGQSGATPSLGGGGGALSSGTGRTGGGGGGGLCGGGGEGGSGELSTGGTGGAAVSAEWSLEPLHGGGGGGAGRGALANFGRGGAGGGALQLTSAVSIALNGPIVAGGGGGGGGGVEVGENGSGGGGGAGGAVLLEAPNVSFGPIGAVRASGGAGGGGAAGTTEATTAGVDGQEGANRPVALGGSGSAEGGPGGNSGGVVALPGSDGTDGTRNGGGGGGGAGCILIRTRGPLPSSATSSPSVVPGFRLLAPRFE